MMFCHGVCLDQQVYILTWGATLTFWASEAQAAFDAVQQ
jgi:hypothetical protein